MKKIILSLIIFVVTFPLLFGQQKDTVDVPGYWESGGQEGTLNEAVQEAINNGTLSNTVFRLKPYEQYVLTATIEVPEGETLELVAPPPGNTQETAPPQILWTASGAVTKEFHIRVFGHLIMKNIWVRYADIDGVQTGTPIVFDQDATDTTQQYGYFEGCVFEWMPCPAVTASGSICVRAVHLHLELKNCYFRNCVDKHYMYYGRAVSFPYDVPDYHTDYVSFENCTFANMGYVYMQEMNNYADTVYFNHCTFYNVVMFSLEGGVYYWANVTNSLFVNAYMLGFIPAQGEDPSGAIMSITPADSIDFKVPFSDKDRHILIAHNAYYVDSWLVDWMRGGWTKDAEWKPSSRIMDVGCPYVQGLYRERRFDEIPYPRPMLDSWTKDFCDSTIVDSATGEVVKAFPYINRANNLDITSDPQTLTETLNPGFFEPPLDLDSLKLFLEQKWSTNADYMWDYKPEAGKNQEWPLPENLAYTNELLKSYAMGGFPLGDLYNWWNPDLREGAEDYYSQWLQQADQEREKIWTWLVTGVHPDSQGNAIKDINEIALKSYELKQNYPNPFNPVTTIEYYLPKAGFVKLKVYNMIGKEVTTIVSEFKQKGNYKVVFDGKDLPSGVYIYRLETDGIMLTRKLLLIK
ncbi:MAG: T9SS type A sorting domain-containing protein [Candidatus Marinimicrobia bacterium]|nr:T9SS type A sorting domain-containing protein [Candidatus Neomarinimicrobiota bacterium]